MVKNETKLKKSVFDKSINLLLIVLVLYFAYRYIGLLYPSSKVNSPAQATAIMYSTKWCPACIEARGFFSQNNIAYFEYDVDKSEQARKQFLQLGGQGVPLIRIGNKTIYGMQREKILQAITHSKKLVKEMVTGRPE